MKKSLSVVIAALTTASLAACAAPAPTAPPEPRTEPVALIEPASASTSITQTATAPYTLSLPVYANTFGMHPLDSTTSMPSRTVGSVRLWDTSTNWGQMQPSQYSAPNWGALDAEVNRARAVGVRDFLMTIGMPAAWATPAKVAVDTSCLGAGYAGLYKSPPDLTYYRTYVTSLAQHVKAAFPTTTWSFEVWNEFDLAGQCGFYAGTGAQMAAMTGVVHRAVKAVNSGYRVVAPSVTVRRGVQPIFGQYLAALKTVKGYGGVYPVDAWSVHPYPKSTGTPADTKTLVAAFRSYLAARSTPARPVWNTEINYGLRGPSGAPAVDIPAFKEPSWLARTYLDSVRTRVARVYWYGWQAKGVTGIEAFTGTPAANAMGTLYGWLAGSTYNGCLVKAGKNRYGTLVANKAYVCQFTKKTRTGTGTIVTTVFRMAWADDGYTSSVKLTAPKRVCTVTGTVGGACASRATGSIVSVTSIPVRIG